MYRCERSSSFRLSLERPLFHVILAPDRDANQTHHINEPRDLSSPLATIRSIYPVKSKPIIRPTYRVQYTNMRSFRSFCALLLTISSLSSRSLGFVFSSPGPSGSRRGQSIQLHTTADRRMGELTSSEEKVFSLMQTLHDSAHPFRVVVVGNGAILETTTVLGPGLSVSQSPKTGKNLMTLASEDKSFEFHVQLADVRQIELSEKETPMKTMRIVRFVGTEGLSMCSLILADPSEAATKWFHGLVEEYGETIALK